MVLGLAFVALFGGRIAPHESIFFVVEHGNDPRPFDPGLVFPFGSDVLGRDLISLVLEGARTTLGIVLLGGLARVAAGALVAVIGSTRSPVRVAVESVADLASAIPATLVALVLVKALTRTSDASIFVFIAALLLTGWAGPYRVIRAEMDRLSHAPFTQGAAVLGMGRARLFWRHQFPHLVPVLATNLTQQVVATLVLVAELGVLGTFVGSTRLINIEESLNVVQFAVPNFASIADPPEWGGLLANARTIESLWTTRWLIFVPGLAFALTALAIGTIGFALSRRYARRDITPDLRGPGAAAIAIALVGLFIGSVLVPERYAAAREWAAAARSEVRSAGKMEQEFSDAGLRPVGSTFAVSRQIDSVVQSAPATLSVAGLSMTESWPRSGSASEPPQLRSFVSAATGGGVVEAPLVFAGRGIVPSETPPNPPRFVANPDIGTLLKDYADDYAHIDVRGKVVLLVRFYGFLHRTANTRRIVAGTPVDESIGGAIKRGAAAVVFIDPSLSDYTTAVSGLAGPLGSGPDPYGHAQQESPAETLGGVPVIILGRQSAAALGARLGIDLQTYLDWDDFGAHADQPSIARDLGVGARVEVPLTDVRTTVTSNVAQVGNAPADSAHILVWSARSADGSQSAAPVLAALSRSLSTRGVPFVFVDFDPSIDARANAQTIRDLMGARRIGVVIVLDHLEGTSLRFRTPYGDLIPAFDLYADRAGARHEVTRSTAPISTFTGAPFVDVKTIIVTGSGGSGDLAPDAAALLGYLAGRFALGAEELPR